MRNSISGQWKKNLLVIALAEFIAMVGFSLYIPFLPLFIQKLGNLSTEQAALWAGIGTGGAGLMMFISAPLWGIVADRWGRKPMLLRAQIGAAVMSALFVVAPNLYFLVGVRIVQGLFTGTIAAASALVASLTPRDKFPLSMGVLMASVFGGQTIGPFIGGVLAGNLGYTTTFVVTACLLLAGGLIILFFVKENFQRPAKGQSTDFKGLLKFASSPGVLSLLVVIALLGVGQQILSPIISLDIRELSGPAGAEVAAGQAFALMGIISAASSVFFGRLNRRVPLRRILIIACIGTGLLYLPPVFARSAAQLVVFVGMTGLFYGGIITSSTSLMGMAVPVSQQGIAYGLSQSASSLGAGIGPLIGGSLASFIDLKFIFAVASGVFLIVALLSLKLISSSGSFVTKP